MVCKQQVAGNVKPNMGQLKKHFFEKHTKIFEERKDGEAGDIMMTLVKMRRFSSCTTPDVDDTLA